MKTVSSLAMQALALARHRVGRCRTSGPSFPIRSSFFAAEQGSALVEIALTLPVFIALITGVGSFGIAFNNQETLTQATGAGGQYLQQIRSTTSNPCADTFTAIRNAAPTLNSANIGLTLNLNGTVVSGTSCSGDQTDLAEGAPVTVTTTYPCNLSIYGMNFATSCQLSAQVTEYEY